VTGSVGSVIGIVTGSVIGIVTGIAKENEIGIVKETLRKLIGVEDAEMEEKEGVIEERGGADGMTEIEIEVVRRHHEEVVEEEVRRLISRTSNKRCHIRVTLTVLQEENCPPRKPMRARRSGVRGFELRWK